MTDNYIKRYNIVTAMNEKKTKIIGLSGSPRDNSNSTILLKQLLSGAEQAGGETVLVNICELDIKPCTHCDYCVKTGKCIISDDMDFLYPMIMSADAIAISSPIYFMSVSAQLKLVIDRLQMFWAYRNDSGKSIITASADQRRKGIFIAVGARNTHSVFSGASTTMKWAFDAIDADLYGQILVGKCEAAGKITSMPEYLQTAYKLGQSLINKS